MNHFNLMKIREQLLENIGGTVIREDSEFHQRQLKDLKESLVLVEAALKGENITRPLQHLSKELIKEKLETDHKFIRDLDGKRKIEYHLFMRLCTEIFSCSNKDNIRDVNILINESIFAIRFGSLSKERFSDKERPILKSLEAALNLIKNEPL